ncbi:OmpA family protein [Vibrio sp. JC009]|uniref:OmpA family protein n=1 Tax=Vibrio sp. JC009 TaxID=2912314 RepID=UPI0023B0BD71|nr:OmpA family protein [Vibrio sp. JC009]WED23139.1 OmpA family protein [Vibrio sp. JC009]
MKLLPYTMSVLVAVTSFNLLAADDDEYDYRATPVANQIADLMDDDKDGVINARDICPGTPFEAQIDNDGCEAYVDNLEDWDLKVLFEHDSANINPAFLNELSSMVEFLEKYPETSIELQGHTSIVGTDEYNQDLSIRRATEVRDKILGMGIDEDRVRIVGYGEGVTDRAGETPIDHAMNRRVVATVVGYERDIIKEWNIFTKRKKSDSRIR